MILALRTDSANSELMLIDHEIIASKTWQADRALATTLYSEIEQLLKNASTNYAGIKAIIVYQGPGSFTGLRISATVANTLAYGLGIAIVGTSGDLWWQDGVQLLARGENHTMVLPIYGQEATITLPKK